LFSPAKSAILFEIADRAVEKFSLQRPMRIPCIGRFSLRNSFCDKAARRYAGRPFSFFISEK